MSLSSILRRQVIVNGYSTHAEYVLYKLLVPGFDILQSNLSVETSRAIAIETVLVNSIAAENLRAQQAENTLNVNLSGEISRAKSAESILDSKINTEITRAISSETKLFTDLKAYTDNQLQSIIGSNIAGALEQLQSLSA